MGIMSACRVFEYFVTVPLTYNRFSIHSNNPTSEIIFKMKDVEAIIENTLKTCEFSCCDNGPVFKNTVKVKLYSINLDDGDSTKGDNYKLFCEISRLLTDDETYAKHFVEKIINRICKELSLVFIKHNANRQSYQPRVEALWSQAEWGLSRCRLCADVRRKVTEPDDNKQNVVHVEENIFIQCGVHVVIYPTIPTEELKIDKWLLPKSDVVEFLMNEYYSALGTEKIKSKFFHLFSIIEFCEKEFEKFNGSKKLLSKDEVDDILLHVEPCIENSKRKRVLSFLKDGLMKVSDIGRARKLENILKWMGIEDYNHHGQKQIINKKLLEELIDVRNKSYHGTKESEEEINKKYSDAVVKLLYIDEMILDFVKNKL